MSDLVFARLDISNFKTFTGQHTFKLNNPPGLYYITGTNKLAPELGANGVGKSTIWDALTWVLWGRTGKDNRPADAIVPWSGKGQPQVGLVFFRDGEARCLLRTRKPNSLRYWPNAGDAGDMGKEIAQEEVPKLLGMTEEMFRRTLVLHQNASLFLDLKPEEQARMFTEALSLDVWLRAVDVASAAATSAAQEADEAVQALRVNEAARQTLAEDLAEFTEQAAVFEQNQAERIRKGAAGVAQLEKDLAKATAACSKKPALPDDSAVRALDEKRLAVKTAVATASRLVKDLTNELADAQDQLAEFNKPKPKCPTCAQPMPSAVLAKSVNELHTTIAAIVSKKKKATAEYNKIVGELEDLDAQVGAARKANQDTRATYESRLNAYEADVRKVVSIQGEKNRWLKQLQEVRAEKNNAAEQVKRLKARRTALRDESVTLKETEDAARIKAEHAKFWQNGFREIRLSIIDQVLLELEMATSRHVAMLGLNDWGIKFETERETKKGTVSTSFNVMLYPPGKDEPVKWESYSGGESQRWQLAVAFALSEVLLARTGIKPNMEVLDEPTRGLSAAGVGDLLEHLRDRAGELGRAIYFVDHHSLDKGAFDKTLLVTNTKKGSSFGWV